MDDFCAYCSSSNVRMSDIIRETKLEMHYTFHCRDCGETWNEAEPKILCFVDPDEEEEEEID